MPSDKSAEIDLTATQPPDLAGDVYAELQKKAALSLAPMAILGVLAGAYIAFGGMFALVALAGASDLPHGIGQVMAGLVFALGLVLVIIAGAELFTGNTLMSGPALLGRISLRSLMTSWSVVYAANLLGSLVIAGLALAAGAHLAGDGAVGRAAQDVASDKSSMSFGAAFASGILANMLVCLAVWMSYSAKSVSDKFFAVLLPIAAFVAAGFEHSVANMFLLPFGMGVELLAQPASDAGGIAAGTTQVTLPGSLNNLLAATLGNILGGGLVAFAYAGAYIAKS
jgi:formate transporter